jgi:hypothetical protein
MKLKFNHSAVSVSEATGIDVEKLGDKVKQTIKAFMEDDEKQTTSHLAEMVNKGYAKAELVILTTQLITDTLQEVAERSSRRGDSLSKFKEILEGLE